METWLKTISVREAIDRLHRRQDAGYHHVFSTLIHNIFMAKNPEEIKRDDDRSLGAFCR